MIKLIKNKSYILSPDNRVYNYILFCDFIFNQKKIFFKNLDQVDKKDIQIILDLKNLLIMNLKINLLKSLFFYGTLILII